MSDPAKATTALTSACKRLRESVMNDLDAQRGGCAWWTGDDWKRLVLVNDYLIGAILQLRRVTELREHHGEEFSAKWTTERHQLSLVRTGKRNDDYPISGEQPSDTKRRFALEAAVRGYFDCAASSLDLFAAITLAVGAFRSPVQKASWSDIARCGRSIGQKQSSTLAEFDTEGRRRQEQFLRQFSALSPLSDDAWLTWTIAYRNTLLHRAGRIVMNVQTIAKRGHAGDVDYHWLLPAHPDRSDAEEMVYSREPRDLFLGIHAGDLIVQIGQRLDDVLHSGLGLVEEFWSERRERPALLAQPVKAQWPEEPAADPQSPPFGETIEWPRSWPLRMHPTDTARWAAVKADDGQVSSNWGTQR